MLSSLRSRSALVREYTARIFNTFASLSTGHSDRFCVLLTDLLYFYVLGRSYLCHYTPLIGVLHEVLVQEESDTAVRQNVLGTLQKLSLRLVLISHKFWCLLELKRMDKERCVVDVWIIGSD